MSLSIRLKLLAAVGALMAACAVASAAAIDSVHQQHIEMALRQSIHNAAETFRSQERSEIDALAATLEVLVSHEETRKAFADRDRDKLRSVTAPLYEGLLHNKVVHWHFLLPEPDRTCFLRVGEPTLHGNVIQTPTFTTAVRSNQPASGLELGKTGLTLRMVRPVRHEGKLIGYMEVGREVSHFLANMKAETGDDFVLMVDKQHVEDQEWSRDNWDDLGNMVVVNTTRNDAVVPVNIDLVPDGGTVLAEMEQNGTRYATGVFPFYNAANQKVGQVLVLHNTTSAHQEAVRSRVKSLLTILGVFLAGSIVLMIMLDRLVLGRLRRMISTLKEISLELAGGNYDAAYGFRQTSSDEVGEFESFFGQFLTTIGNTLKEAARLRSSDHR